MSDKTKTFSTRIKSKRDTSANWESANPVLLNGEKIIVDTAAGEVREKIGNGVKTYSQLPFTDEKIRGLITEKADEVELERIKYYGDPDIVPSDSSYFTVNSTGETITGLTDTGKTQAELVIPYEINGVMITYIQNYAFYNCGSITSITTPNSIHSFGGSSVFNGCKSLKTINIPNRIDYIDESAFQGCTSLTSINLPDSIKSIYNDAFSGCTSLVSIKIPDSVTSISFNAFSGCTSLVSIDIPNSVTSIGSGAFNGCTNLTIYCEQGSYAETFAKGENIPIVYTDIDPSKYLTKDNTQTFTPTSDYQPATKKYVDDSAATKVNKVEGKSLIDSDVAVLLDTDGNGALEIYPDCGDPTMRGSTKVKIDSEGACVRVVTGETRIGYDGITVGHENSLDSHGDVTVYETVIGETSATFKTHKLSEKANSSDVLEKTNTTEFTPTADYQPATKKYVDDAIKTAIEKYNTEAMALLGEDQL